MKDQVFARNMKVLRRRHPVLARVVEMNEDSPTTYLVEEARSGKPTLALRTGEKTLQIHSRFDPEKEARQQVAGLDLRNPKLLLIYGLGLGYHVRACAERFAKESLFIVVVEREMRALRVAVEQVDLTDLFEDDRFRWVVGVPETEAYPVQHEMIREAGITFQLILKTLQVFRHPALTQRDGDYYGLMLRGFREAAQNIIFNYGNCPKDSMIGVENIMQNLSTIMRNPGIQDLYGAFRGVPGILVSTGPSLDKNIRDLFEAVGKCVLVSADSAFKVLLDKGLKPHAVATLERIIEVAHLFEPLPAEAMQDVWLAGTPVILPQVYEAWKGPTFMVYRNFAHFTWLDMPKGTLPIGPSCSNLAFKVLEALGCDPIILVGQDCAFASAEKTHAEGASSITNLGLKPENLFPVRGNTQEWVYTDHIFDLFRKTFVTDVAGYKGTCINATEGGAFIEGTKTMPLREAIQTHCRKPVDTLGLFRQRLRFPSPPEIQRVWKKFRRTMEETRKEVQEVIDFCVHGEALVNQFELELEAGGFRELDDFLARFPEKRLEEVHAEMARARAKVITFGKYFNLYLMHIVQMIIIQFEMDFNELPSLCDDPKRVKLQGVRMMKRWFPTIGEVCSLALKLLEDAYARLRQEFD